MKHKSEATALTLGKAIESPCSSNYAPQLVRNENRGILTEFWSSRKPNTRLMRPMPGGVLFTESEQTTFDGSTLEPLTPFRARYRIFFSSVEQVKGRRMGLRVKLLQNITQLWIIVPAENERLAWSGSRWVSIDRNGQPAGDVKSMNFPTATEAVAYAQSVGFEVEQSLYMSLPADSD